MKSAAADPVALVYHELRAPLGLMATAARSAAEDCEDEDLRKRCEIIVRAAERMLSTAASVLSLAEGSIPSETERVSLNEVAQRLAAEARALNLPVFVTRSEPECVVEVPLTQLETLIQSLINNAQQHGNINEGCLIELSIRHEGDCAIFDVRNRIPTERRHKGIGASTYLANRIASRFGGVVETEVRGDYYTASVVIPLAEPID